MEVEEREGDGGVEVLCTDGIVNEEIGVYEARKIIIQQKKDDGY